MVLTGQISLGTLFGLIQLNNPVQGCFLTLGTTISSLQGALAAGDRLLAVLNTAPLARAICARNQGCHLRRTARHGCKPT